MNGLPYQLSDFIRKCPLEVRPFGIFIAGAILGSEQPLSVAELFETVRATYPVVDNYPGNVRQMSERDVVRTLSVLRAMGMIGRDGHKYVRRRPVACRAYHNSHIAGQCPWCGANLFDPAVADDAQPGDKDLR